ncbi:MAG: hypothetical protein ACHP7D_08935 [Lysobacterales bacterium]|jgi:hypothetical protein
MNKLGLAALLGMLGIAACSHLREPTDAQLATLLRSERATAVDASAQLDASAIDCLKAWSGDAELLKGLSVRYAGEDGKAACRTRLDGWIADAARNPDHFTVQELSAPKTVRRAIELQEARRLAALTDPAKRQIPPALLAPAAAAPVPPATPDPSVDLGVAGAKLEEAETLCQQTQQAAADAQAAPNLKSFAAYCGTNLRRVRTSMEQAARNGQGAARLDALAGSATSLANTARNVLAAGKQP